MTGAKITRLFCLIKYNQLKMKKTLTLKFSIDYIGQVIGSVTVTYTIYLHADGTMRTIDIKEALFNDKDIADYVSAAQPDVWDEWLEKGENHWRGEHEEPEMEVDDVYGDAGEGYFETNTI